MTTRTSAFVVRSVAAAGLALAVTAASSAALAQTPPPEGYPPAQGYPPPGYPPPQGYPPPGYPPPQGYPPPGAYYPPPAAGYAGPKVITDYEDGQTIPPGYHKDTRIRAGLVGAGAGLLGGFWLVTALSSVLAADIEKNSTLALGAIPVAGPFTLITQCSNSIAPASCDFFSVLDGVVQVAGLAMLIGGLAAPRTVLVRNDVGKLTIMPKPMMFGKTGAGVGLVATF